MKGIFGASAREKTVSMNSIMDIINIPMGYVIRFLNNIVGNYYIIALFLFAIFIEIILLPFGIKQQKNSIKQAKLRPKEMAIRKKYAGRNDNVTKQKVTQEIQELYQREGYSPFGGCLPLLIQMPIMIALYYIVLNPLHYICQFSAETIEKITEIVKAAPAYVEATFTNGRTIELMDAMKEIGLDAFSGIEEVGTFLANGGEFPNVSFLGLNLAQIPSLQRFDLLLLVPVLTFVVYFFSGKLMRKLSYQPTMSDDAATGCSNKMMDWMMPLMSVYICFIVPAAVGVYWIFKSIIGVIKQFILKKAMPVPTFTEEDYKEAEKEMKAQNKGKTYYRNADGSKPRSLHHIDDDDYEQPAEPAKPKKAETGMASLVDTPTLKDDDKDEKDNKED